jgi:release factor glutamine methyltransferase
MQLREALRAGLATLLDHHVASAGLAAELLLMHVLGCDRGYLYSHPELELTSEACERYFQLIAERCSGKPTQYITGHQEFWGLDLEVTPDVLIPRPETEGVVEAVVELARASGGRSGPTPASKAAKAAAAVPLRIVDVGTGSGAIALALTSELPQAQVFATDISRPALAVARRNACRLGLAARVRLVETDLLSCFLHSGDADGFDFVVSNPPYVGRDELDAVQREVREFEPRLAWGGLERGGEIYRRLFPQARACLRPGGYAVVEVGYNQAEAVVGLLGSGWTGAAVRPDLAGIPRVVVARKAAVSYQQTAISNHSRLTSDS